MTWQNMFDGGACNVYFASPQSLGVWRGILGKGDSSPAQTDTFGNRWTASVTADGQVILDVDSSDASYQIDDAAGSVLEVDPSFDVTASPTRARAITLVAPNASPHAYNDYYDSQESGATSIALTAAIGDAVTPDPATFDAYTLPTGDDHRSCVGVKGGLARG